MNNQDIIDNIKSHLSGEKEIDVPYLQMELDIYKKMNNEEVIYAIANLLFGYMDPSIKEKLDLKTHEVLNERRLEYETVVDLINNEKYEEAKEILIRHTNIYKKATYTKEQNFYDFDQMIEYYIFCENVKNAKKLHVRRYPEPVAYYMYQLATIYEKEENYKGGCQESGVEGRSHCKGSAQGDSLGVLELYFVFFSINTNFIQLI